MAVRGVLRYEKKTRLLGLGFTGLNKIDRAVAAALAYRGAKGAYAAPCRAARAEMSARPTFDHDFARKKDKKRKNPVPLSVTIGFGFRWSVPLAHSEGAAVQPESMRLRRAHAAHLRIIGPKLARFLLVGAENGVGVCAHLGRRCLHPLQSFFFPVLYLVCVWLGGIVSG